MMNCEVEEFDALIESALDAGRAAARVYGDVERALADWPLIEAFREGFGQEALTYERPRPPQLCVVGVKPAAAHLADTGS
jgi:hypothetical protein